MSQRKESQAWDGSSDKPGMENILLLSCELVGGSLVTTEKEMKTVFFIRERLVLYLTTLVM